jgi:serine/threonine-protein kinase
MALAAGARLGPYEILSALGAGGMGEVYKARDTRLGRDVALKILPELFATDPDRLVRFQREAQALASLNHPNIAAIYGLEESDGIRAIVMELVEGPTLADRLAHGALRLDEAMPIAKQIAAALEAAHERGVIHRDVKPANIKVTSEDQVKVLDFGLAAMVEDPSRPDVNAAHSPTLTFGATRDGMILGTAAYMSPEQAAGKPVDKRADIWSFGVVLWEMLTGKKLFDAETVSHTLADVLRAPIDFEQVPRGTPMAVHTLLQRCLDRDAKRRLRDIGEARVQIENYFTNPRSAWEPRATESSRSPLAVGVSIAAAVLLAAFVALSVVHFQETPSAALTTRFQVLPPDRATSADYPTISPDGRRLAFVATVDGKKAPVGSAPRFAHSPLTRGNRGRGVALLVSRQPLLGILLGRHAQEGGCRRRTPAGALSRRGSPRWDMESRRHNSFFGGTGADSPSVCQRRGADNSHQGQVSARVVSQLAAVPAGWPPLHLLALCTSARPGERR